MNMAQMSTVQVHEAVSPSHLRLTRRGRAVIAALIAIPIAVVGAVVLEQATAADSADASSTSPSTRFDYVQVQAGESLWELAASIAPQADPRDVVSDILHLNQLGSGDLQPGQQLAIPEQYAR